MAYFESFPLARYNNQYQIDLTQGTVVAETDRRSHIETEIIDGETPEMLADRMYDEPEMSWVILVYNKIVNLFEQWPLEPDILASYVNQKYDDPNDIHHYVSAATGLRVDISHPDYDRIPVTNYEHENNLNEDKRAIRIPIPEVADQMVIQHNELLSR